MVKFIRNWICIYIYTLLIITASLMPVSEELPMADVPLIDKWVHFVMYSMVAVCGAMDVGRRKSAVTMRVKNVALGLLAYAIVLGGVMELLQGMTSYRSADWWDFVANSIGAGLGSSIFLMIFRKNGK